jgi:hypothetical protein
MQLIADPNSGSTLRLGKQPTLLLRIYHANLINNPTSHATKSSRSNLMVWSAVEIVGSILTSLHHYAAESGGPDTSRD